MTHPPASTAALIDDCKSDGLSDLADSIPEIETFVRSWWTESLLPWFTDHGPDHSLRVAEYALSIVDPTDMPAQYQLTTLERYVLWASSWLHDLGMQTLPGVPLGALTEENFDQVRHEHPDQSAQVILTKAVEIGLPRGDSPLVQLIAWVARSHGTNYYDPSMTFLRSLPSVRNQRVRGPLLASVLLMADELDLHYQRAKVLPGAWGKLTAVAEAHAFKHRQVLDCKVSHENDAIEIAITLLESDGICRADSIAVEQWITHKLRRQIALVEQEFVGGFGGRRSFSRGVNVERVKGVMGATAPDSEVMAVIHAENAQSDMINHRQLFRDVKEAVIQRKSTVIEGELAREFVDLDGREDLLTAVATSLAAEGSLVIGSRCSYESGGAATAEDVLQEWVQSCTDQTPSPGVADLNQLRAAVGDCGRHVLVVGSSLDRLPLAGQEWLLGEVVASLREAGDVSVLLSAAPGNLREYSDCFMVAEELSGAQVTQYLSSLVPWNVAQAEAGAKLRYAEYKRLSLQHLLTLRSAPS